ncbi:D-2-hydroxyacid dehydrogenase [uncultured Tateyamaria sp.]|uniref:D-2-hydroxyacid dehydrogenase n=1 Tax=uncultured Tateyamaria sp. TaxID=455651 RepID=UPI0026108E6F|nr:D-2-hydroxyacid dehydrogenase [uncultured Tateyamaria sp.]
MTEPIRVVLHTDASDGLVERLIAASPQAQVRVCDSYDALPEMLTEFAPQVVYTVRFNGTPGFPRAALFGPDGPQWIANGGVGTDHFGQWDAQVTTVTNAAGVAADMMAEYVMGGFLHFMLDVPGLQADKGARVWAARTVRPLKGKTLLIVGLGHTGKAIAQLAKAFGIHVIGTRATPRDTDNVDEVHGADALNSLLERADFIAISTPLTAQTRGLIGVTQIGAMKRGVVLADVSRGGVVDQTALAQALAEGHVAAAALDVFEVEPLPESSPLWGLDNVLISPHCASVHDGWEDVSFDLFLDNLARWSAGEALVNVVDPIRGY